MTDLIEEGVLGPGASGIDPHLHGDYLSAVAAATGQRAVEVRCAGTGWTVRYALLLRAHGDSWLARTPDYGGPMLEADDPAAAAPLARAAIDRVLIEHGVVSEVSQCSPWLPHRADISAAWAWRPTKPVCLLPLPVEPEQLSHGRRSDVRSWRLPVADQVFDAGTSEVFAARYAEAMDRLDAAERWRFDRTYFAALADTGLVHHVSTGDDPAGAAALFLLGPSKGVYLFSVRWGAANGAASRVLWHAATTFTRYGVEEILIGGGASAGPDDPLLAFKRSWGGREATHLVGARCFDEAAQRKAEDDGIRPLPEGWVRA